MKADSLRVTVTASETIRFECDGAPVDARKGESVAAALLASGRKTLRRAPDGAPRGAFCFMGACQECVMRIDGRITESCRQPATEGLRVESL